MSVRVKIVVNLFLVLLEDGGLLARTASIHRFLARGLEQLHDLRLVLIRETGHDRAVTVVNLGSHLDIRQLAYLFQLLSSGLAPPQLLLKPPDGDQYRAVIVHSCCRRKLLQL
jgi:hypothetical protein